MSLLKTRLLLLPITVILLSCHGAATTPNSAPECGTVPYPSNTGTVTPNPITDSPQVWSFVSAPDLHPMKVTINTYEPGASPDLIFIDPFTDSSNTTYGQPGALILDNNGNPHWFRPLSSPNLMNNDFRVQQLNGQPVLTFWQGTIASAPTYTNRPMGSSEPGSCYYILDNRYRVVKTVSARNGFTSDIHEFLITPKNTALFLSTNVVPMDLTPFGGPQNGSINDFAIQEVDLNTNELVFFWKASEHIPLADSNQPAATASASNNIWDAYHLNSIGLTDSADDILVSSRNTWTIYRINKPTGNIVWRLGGAESDFTIENGAQFSWQHDARMLSADIISLFNDNCCGGTTMIPPGTPPSHGLLLKLDLSQMTASVHSEYYHSPNLIVATRGSTQTLPNGNVFVGWGQSAYYGEYAAGGNSESNPAWNTLYDAQMPGTNYTYRAYRNHWTATPYYPPSIAVQADSSTAATTRVYASWNGATEVDAWQVFAGATAAALSLIKEASKTGFETAIPVTSRRPYFQVKALNSGQQIIGVSNVVRLSE